MQEEIEVKLERVDQRSKSNLHQIDEIKENIKELKEENKAINEIATSVKVMTEHMVSIEKKVDETAEGLERTERKIDNKEAEQNAQKIREFGKIKIAVVTAVCSTVATTIVLYLLSAAF